MALNLVLPGAGLFGVDTGVAVVFVAATVAAVVLWLRWGADWLVVVVLAVATTISALAVGGSSGGIAAAPASGELPRVRAAHEFPLVLVLVGFLSGIARVLGGLPGGAAGQRRRAARARGLASPARLPVVDRCRAVAIAALAARASIVRADAGPRPGVEGGAVDGVDRGA